nr:type III secretion system chaperone [Succinatimonas hippei]
MLHNYYICKQNKEDTVISYQNANTLLREFSLQEEIELLELDEDNYCQLVSADEHVVHIRFDEELGTLIVFGSIGTLSKDEEISKREMRALLTSNLMWQDTMGATITLAPESDTVLLQQMWLPELATVEKLSAFLQSFVLLLTFWEKRFSELSDELMEREQPFYVWG